MKRRRVKNEEEGGEKKKPDGYTPTTLCWWFLLKSASTWPRLRLKHLPPLFLLLLVSSSSTSFFFTVSRQFFFPLSLPVPPSSENDPARARDDSTGSSLSPKSHFLFERNLTPTLKPSPRAISEIQQVGVVGWSADRPTEKKKEKKEAEEIEWRLPVGRRRGLHDTRTAEQGGAENEFN